MKDRTTLNLAGVNVLVGANSAGKSSVLHSVLLIAQTLANPLIDRPLVLNGHLVRLGLADDVLHVSGDRNLEIGFDLVPTVEFTAPGAPKRDFDRLSLSASFGPTNDNDFSVVATEVTAEAGDESASIAMRARNKSETRRALIEAGLLPDVADRWLPSGLLDVEGDVASNSVGVLMRQFLPSDVWRVANAVENQLTTMRFLITRYELDPENPWPNIRTFVLEPETVTFIRRYVQETLGTQEAATIIDADKLDALTLIPAVSAPVRQLLSNSSGNAWYVEHQREMPFVGTGESAGLPGNMSAGLDYARRWFAENVFHLGPLRAAPQPLYELPLAMSTTSVGRNGEFTAAVLSAQVNRYVISPSPNGGAGRRKRLGDAVNEWVSEMNLLSSVHSKEQGKLGYELHVAIEGVTRDLDLTTVGVGVSQALPIIVLGLIADPGSLLLFEQPELHLHPDVQAALGDFFLALARTGRQLIIETHSEYLVNRLRRRAAAEPDSDVTRQVRLFFFERDGASSTVGAHQIGAGGAMVGWPQGFLDTASREVEAIARADQKRSAG